jgi:ELWxxDGT repeat protein
MASFGSILRRSLGSLGVRGGRTPGRRTPASTTIHVEPLENRELLASPVLLKTVPESPNRIRRLTTVGDTVFFTARDDEHGRELWKTDGTPSGTVLLKDINPGWDSSSPHGFAGVGNDLYFIAWEPSAGESLWKSDGTSAGTVMVADINPDTGTGFLFDLTNVNGTLFFVGDDGVHGDELWKSDGTADGTQLVKDIRPGSSNSHACEEDESDFPSYSYGVTFIFCFATNYSAIRGLRAVDGVLHFTATDGTHGGRRWTSDGTSDGTTMFLPNIHPGGLDLVQLGDLLLFAGSENATGSELAIARTDGTTASIVDINPGINGSDPVSLVTLDDSVFFTASDPVHGRELWKTDGTEQGTVIVKDLYPGPNSSSPINIFVANGSLYFSAYDGVQSRAWKSDGTSAGTMPLTSTNNSRVFSVANGAVVLAERASETQLRLSLESGDQSVPFQMLPATSLPSSVMSLGNDFVVLQESRSPASQLWFVAAPDPSATVQNVARVGRRRLVVQLGNSVLENNALDRNLYRIVESSSDQQFGTSDDRMHTDFTIRYVAGKGRRSPRVILRFHDALPRRAVEFLARNDTASGRFVALV